MPCGYFDAESMQVMAEFRERVSGDPLEEHMESFPDAFLMGKVEKTWQTAAAGIYHNWLRYTAAKKTERTSLATLAQAG
jgi:hypothetical protein